MYVCTFFEIIWDSHSILQHIKVVSNPRLQPLHCGQICVWRTRPRHQTPDIWVNIHWWLGHATNLWEHQVGGRYPLQCWLHSTGGSQLWRNGATTVQTFLLQVLCTPLSTFHLRTYYLVNHKLLKVLGKSRFYRGLSTSKGSQLKLLHQNKPLHSTRKTNSFNQHRERCISTRLLV